MLHNAGFEGGYPSKPKDINDLNDWCNHWKTYAGGSADWFKDDPDFLRGRVKCNSSSQFALSSGTVVPTHEGIHYAGMLRRSLAIPGEGIQQKMRKKLDFGTYKLSFWYLLPCDTHYYALKAYLSTDKDDLDLVIFDDTLAATNIGTWQKFEKTIVVPLSFDSQFDWFVLMTTGEPSGPGTAYGSYLYLDDFFLGDPTCTGCSPQGLISWNQNILHDFSPNNDGILDTFFIENINNATYYEFEVFDRWGAKVFTELGFNANGFQNYTIKWDGRNKNGNFLQSPNTFYMVISMGNCDSEIQFQKTVAYCRSPGCDLGPMDTVPNYVPPLFGLESPPTHYRNLELYGGIYYGNHHWYACDSIFIGGANSQRTPYFIAGSTSILKFTASDVVEIVQGDDVDIHPGADVDLLPGPVACCPELRLMNPNFSDEEEESPSDILYLISGLSGRIPDHSINIAPQLPHDAAAESDPTDYKFELNTFPNPFSDILTLEFSVPQPQIVTLSILDIHMRPVATLLNAQFTEAGKYRQAINLNTLPGGIYFCLFQGDSEVQWNKIVRQ
jgi:gliding motility-associated-like protein